MAKITPEEVGEMFRTMRFDCVVVWLIGLLDIIRKDWKSYDGHEERPVTDYIARYIVVKELSEDNQT